jgi:protein-L-isoaspartate(D-aspartate) O-methyltransferase
MSHGLPADRALFIPDLVYRYRDEEWVPVNKATQPEVWDALVRSDDPIVTQVKNGMWPASSASAVWVMKDMIGALRLKPGMRVLEIGTGTGYNAACLAELGAEVVSVEIDQTVADQARVSLRAAGYPEVEVITRDGELGYPARAPYDRVIATAAAHTIPYPWVEQTRDGGLIVAPYTGEGHQAALLVLTVRAGAATGGAEGEAAFMPLRGQKLTQAELQGIESHPGLRIEVTESGQQIHTG